MRSTLFMVLAIVGGGANAASLALYDDQLENGFGDQSWANGADYNLANASPVHGGTDSIAFTPNTWGGLQFVANNTEFNFIDYQSLTFWVNGGGSGGQTIWVIVTDNYNAASATIDVATLVPGGSLSANVWLQATLDFNSTGLTSGTFNGLNIMDGTGTLQTALYIDDIVFNQRTAPPPPPPTGNPVNVSVDVGANAHPFSPNIFGVAFGDATRNGQMGYSVRRWGGNSVTRYNWQVDVHNTASDYFYENIPGATDRTQIPPIGNDADAFVGEAIGGGSQPLMTIPTIGLTPRNDSPLNHPYFAGFSVMRYGAQQAVDPYDTDAGNGYHTNGSPITGNNAGDTSSASTPSFEQGWIAHFQSAFGSAANGGVKFYTLDNEVMLWNSTHRDVHPNPTTYDETWTNAQNYGAAIKQQDSGALVTGPVTWGYCDLFGSAADNCVDGADRQAHGGLAFVAWYLQRVCAHPLTGGAHVVDYVDLHYYPQGTNIALNDDDSPATAALRLRSLKELYDPTWVSESWIADLGDTDSNHYDKPDLIPRVRAWIDQYCPGTKLAITEYNWGNDGTNSGAVAQAELLAIFARDGVDLATRWVAPNANTKAERGYSIFLNYDGAGAKVQGDSVGAQSGNVDQIGAYAFHLAGQRTMVLLTNKDTTDSHDAVLTFDSAHNSTWKLFGFDPNNALHLVSTGSISGTTLTLPALLPMSANLLVIPENDVIFVDGFDGP